MSSKTVAEKLLIKPDTTVWLSQPARQDLINPLPAGARVVDELEDGAIAVVVANDESSLRATLDAHKDRLAQPNILWVAYPKANRTDINRDTLWPILGEYGMRPTSQVSVDLVWSALRFRPPREGEAPFSPAN